MQLLLDQSLSLAALASADIGIYLVLMAGVLRARKTLSLTSDPSEAFLLLQKSIRKAFADAPAGFTIREGLARSRLLAPRLDWSRIDEALVRYEGWRYGGEAKNVRGNAEVLKLARSLSRSREKWQV